MDSGFLKFSSVLFLQVDLGFREKLALIIISFFYSLFDVFFSSISTLTISLLLIFIESNFDLSFFIAKENLGKFKKEGRDKGRKRGRKREKKGIASQLPGM